MPEVRSTYDYLKCIRFKCPDCGVGKKEPCLPSAGGYGRRGVCVARWALFTRALRNEMKAGDPMTTKGKR